MGCGKIKLDMLKSLMAAVAGVLLLSVPAQAEDALDLVKNCMSNDRIIVGGCIGYLLGIWDMTVNLPLHMKVIRQDRICIDDKESLEPTKLREIWLGWAQRHPEQLDHHSASVQVQRAFVDEYPCREY